MQESRLLPHSLLNVSLTSVPWSVWQQNIIKLYLENKMYNCFGLLCILHTY